MFSIALLVLSTAHVAAQRSTRSRAVHAHGIISPATTPSTPSCASSAWPGARSRSGPRRCCAAATYTRPSACKQTHSSELSWGRAWIAPSRAAVRKLTYVVVALLVSKQCPRQCPLPCSRSATVYQVSPTESGQTCIFWRHGHSATAQRAARRLRLARGTACACNRCCALAGAASLDTTPSDVAICDACALHRDARARSGWRLRSGRCSRSVQHRIPCERVPGAGPGREGCDEADAQPRASV